MFDVSILDSNLNAAVSYQDFFRALGYTHKDTIYFRTFDDKKKGQPGHNKQVPFDYVESIMKELHHENQEGRGVYFIVNGGGHKDDDVKDAKALFIDFDDFSFEEQLRRINSFPLPPSIIIKTRKSLHCYWILQPADPDRRNKLKWRVMQNRLIKHFGSDESIENHSRVMRVYGFDHMKQEPLLVRLIHFDPALKYDMQDFHSPLPMLSESEYNEVLRKENIQTKTAAAGGLAEPLIENERIPVGQGHKAVMVKIGELLNKMGDTCDDKTILAALKTWFIQRYEGETKEGFDSKYLKSIQKLRQTRAASAADPDYWRYAIKAWEAKNGRKFEKGIVSWYEVQVAGEEAQEQGLTFEDADHRIEKGWQDHKAAQEATGGPQPDTDNPRPDGIADYIQNEMAADLEHFQRETKTGFSYLDYVSGGLYAGLYVIAAVSSLGKTTFIHQMADNMAAAGHDVLFFSLEQSRLELVTKSISRYMAKEGMEGAITSLAIRKGHITKQVQAAARGYMNAVNNRLSIIEGNFDCNIKYISDYVKGYIERNKDSESSRRPIVIIDYLQVMQPPETFKGTAREVIDMTVTELKRLSRDLDITIICVSSVNRTNYLSPIDFESLKESGGIEFTCDVVWGLQLQCLNDPDFEDEKSIIKKRKMVKEAKRETPRKVELVCLKNRYGISSYSSWFNYYPAVDYFVEDQLGASASFIREVEKMKVKY